MATITINDTLILDQTAGLQDDDTALDNTLLGLTAAFRTTLNGLAGDLALSAGQLAYAASVKGAVSTAGYVTVDPEGGDITNLFFSDPDGNFFNGDQVIYNGSPLQTIDGANIYLWSLGDGDIVLATTSSTINTGDVVAAFYLNDAVDNLSATIEMVTFIPLDHPDDTNHDDRVDWTDLLNITATGSTSFDFDALKSGSSLWVAVGSSSGGVLVTGGSPDVDGNGKKTNDSDVIHTSQGGDGTTIGINNQLFDNAGETGVFTLVTGLDTITGAAGATGDYVVDPNLNDAKLEGIDYDGYLNVVGAGIYLSQSQGSPAVTKSFDIELWSAGGGTTPEEGFGYISGLASDTAVNVGTVTVVNDDGEVVGVWAVGDSGDTFHSSSANGETDVTVEISGNHIEVDGVFGEFTVSWTSDGTEFNRFTLISESGQFDVGRVDIAEGLKVTEPVGDSLFVDDDGPSVDLELSGTAELLVDESTLPVSDSILAADLFSTNTADFGTDGPGTDDSVYKLLLTDDNSGLFDTATGDEVLLTINLAGTLITGAVTDGGPQTVFTIEIDPDTGEVTLTQMRALINGDPSDPDESDTPLTLPTGLVLVERTITDGDDDSASDNVDISAIFKFEDDGPSLPPATQDVLELITDDTDLTPDVATLSTDLIFTAPPVFGNDGPNQTDPIVYELRLAGLDPDPDSGLVDTETGKAILLKKVGADIIGYVDTNGDGTLQVGETTAAIKYSLSGNDPLDPDTETVTFTQYRAVLHDDVNDPNEALSPETINGGLVFIDQTAIDGDGDVSDVVSFDLGAITQLLDDGPSIGPVANSIVDFAAGDSANEDLNGDVGNDPNTSPYTLTYFTPTLTIAGVDLEGVLAGDAKSVTYYADTDGSGTFGDGTDVAYYMLELGDQGGEGDYTFTVLVNPPPAFTEFNFDTLPSGSNLFGIVGDADAGLIIFGEDIGLKPDNTYIANQTQEIKTSQAGLHDTIGIESQMFDPGDAAYFTFVNDPDPNFTGTALGSTEADDADNILYGSTLEGDSAFIRIAQLQGNTDPSMSIQLFNIDDTNPQGVDMIDARGINEAGKDPDVIAVRVYDPLGNLLEDTDDLGNFNDPNITVSFLNGVATVTGFDENYKIEWDADEDFDQTLITGVAGKFDIGGFGFLQGNDTPDQVLDFTAQVTDGDGDYATASWKVGIDGTGIYDDNLVSGVII